jgi:glycerol-3-phosphate dehydrogenase
VTPGDVEDLLQKFNRAWPSARLGFDDVSFVHCGLLPGRGGRPASVDVQLAKHSQVRDHGREGIPGLISVTGVKYTLARQVAEKAVDLVFRLRGQKAPSCATDNTPVHGGDIVRFQEFLRAEAGTTFLPPEGTTTYRLLHNYGSAYRRVLAHLDEESLGGPWWSNDLAVWKAEVRHGVREEMAQKLVDIVFRRTELGTAGHPGKALLMTCAETMGAELGWSNHQLRQELQEVEQKYPALGVMV